MLGADVSRALQELLTPNFGAFQSFLSELRSPDSDRRRFAEQVLEQLKQHPDLLVQYLISAIRVIFDEGHRIFAAVLLRKCLILDSPGLWPSLSDSVKQIIKNGLFAALSVEKKQNVLLELCDVISELVDFLLDESSWPELLPKLFELLKSISEPMLFAGFRLVGSLSLKEGLDLFKDSIPTLLSCFDGELGEGVNAPFQVEVIKAFCNVVQSLNGARFSRQFQPLVPKIINSLKDFQGLNNIFAVEEILKSLTKLVQKSLVFLTKAFPEMIPVILEIASSEAMTDEIRILAAELLITLCEKKDEGLKSLLEQIPTFVEDFFEVLMLFLMDIEDVPEWHEAVEEEDEDLGNGELYNYGDESFDRVAIGLGGKILVPTAVAVLTNCSKDSDWKRRHGALICLSQIAKGCADLMLQEVDQLTDLCINGLNDDTAKVRWAACHAIGQLCTHLGPDLQASYHQKVVPALIGAMRDKDNPRVQAHAVFPIMPRLLQSAVQGFNKNAGVIPNFISQMTGPIWRALVDAFPQEPNLKLQQTCLSSIASIVDLLSPEYLTHEMVESCFGKLKKNLEEAEERRTNRIHAFEDGVEDEDFVIGQPPDDDQEEKGLAVLDEISTVLSSFMKKLGDNIKHYIETLMPFIQQLLEIGRSPTERRIGICILDDILEHCPQAGDNYLYDFLPRLVSGLMHPDADIRKCSIYGLGTIARKYPKDFQPFIPVVVPDLVNIIKHPSAKTKENELATDNAISAIGKILHQFPDKIDAEIVEQIWLKNLPLIHDENEAKVMHEIFIKMVEEHDSRIFGAGHENLQRIVEVLVGILAAGNSMTKLETGKRVYDALQFFSSTHGEDMIRTIISGLTTKQQKNFEEYCTKLSRVGQ